jgi:uncharacterized protein YjbI with pentapeptide repeats
MNRETLNETIMNHAKYLNGDADGVRANLSGTDLSGTNLRGANLSGSDLSGADIDYSCWPIWCGSLDVVVDKRIAVQLAYHFCRLICDDPEYISARNSLINFANQFHRADECGKLERIEVKEEKGEVCK